MILRTISTLLLAISFDAAAQRTIDVTMSDTMRYDPAEITVKRGETVRFAVTNSGRLAHEMVIGTKKQLEEHAKHMREHPGMNHAAHSGHGMLRLDPGGKGEMSYAFAKPGTFYYGCLEPGHFEAGMIGTVTVTER